MGSAWPPGARPCSSDAPAAQGQQADQRLEERRLAGAVGPDDRHLGAVRHVHGHVVEGRPAVVATVTSSIARSGRGGAVAGAHLSASTMRRVSNFIMSM